jgi:hypothetical protein
MRLLRFAGKALILDRVIMLGSPQDAEDAVQEALYAFGSAAANGLRHAGTRLMPLTGTAREGR